MSAAVVDASVIAACLLPGHVLGDDARHAVSRVDSVLAPALAHAECGNAIWKQARRDSLSGAQVDELVRDLLRFPMKTLSLRFLSASAVLLATRSHHPVYDCYYLAAAIRHRCPLVTADKRLAALADEVGLGNRVILIGRDAAQRSDRATAGGGGAPQ